MAHQIVSKPKLFRSTIIFMYAVAVFWVLFAILWLFRDSDYRYFYAISAVSYAIFIAVLAYLLNKRRVWVWWVTLVFSAMNIILTFADQIGWFDLAYVVPAIVLFALILAVKKNIYQVAPNEQATTH